MVWSRVHYSTCCGEKLERVGTSGEAGPFSFFCFFGEWLLMLVLHGGREGGRLGICGVMWSNDHGKLKSFQSHSEVSLGFVKTA